jgi:hypothetical protein
MNQKLSTVLFLQLAVIATAACQSDPTGDPTDDQDELLALLRDQPLTQVFGGAASTATPGVGVTESGKSGKHSNVILPSAAPLGAWDFDDCSDFRTTLFDSSFNDNDAFRSVGVTCTAGMENTQAVMIAAPEDIIYVPDQPDFTFEAGVTVAGWFNPNVITGTKTLFRKRDKGTSSFALVLNGGKFQFVVNVGGGRAIAVTSPAQARVGVFQHVAATYDGATARMYIDGVQVSSFTTAGSIPPGPGPVLMGNDGSERRFSGAIDSTLFATHALTADEVSALLCFPQPPGVVVTPSTAETPAGVAASFDVAITNNSPARCGASVLNMQPFVFQPQLTLDPPSFSVTPTPPIAPGATVHLPLTATPALGLPAGFTFQFQVAVFDNVTGFFTSRLLNVTVIDASGCNVSTPRELMIREVSVVEDPIRTVFTPGSMDPRNGVWTFKHLMEAIAPTPADAPAMVESVMTSMLSPQTINGFTVAVRPGMQSVMNAWPRTPDGALDLARAPLRLQAIVNRFDLRDLANGDAGEGRFVFAFNDPSNPSFPLQATAIFEYKLPAATDADVLDWAQSFHALGAMQFSEGYNAALQAITERFAAHGARPGSPNGSALNAFRTNEISFSSNGIWELREFHLSAATGLATAPLALTPDGNFNNSSTLASFINANEAAIIAEHHVVPEQFNGAPFQAGAVFNTLGTWFAPGVNPEARHHFALNTCNGCHASAETNVGFLQISPRSVGATAGLSPFLTGTTRPDPVTGQPRTFNDLGRRNTDLRSIVCTDGAALSAETGTTLQKGIQRVH